MDKKLDKHKLLSLRNAKAWSQQHLADVSGLSLRTIQRIEKTQSASQASIQALASAFDTTPNKLLVDEPVQVKPQHSRSFVTERKLLSSGKLLPKFGWAWLVGMLAMTTVVVVYWSQSVNAKSRSATQDDATVQVQVNADALKEGLHWLTVLDDHRYEQSWQQSAPGFKERITESAWIETIANVRQPLGSATARTLVAAQQITVIPGLPPGEYVILSFSTVFDSMDSASIETLSMVKIDSKYRAIGYFIR